MKNWWYAILLFLFALVLVSSAHGESSVSLMVGGISYHFSPMPAGALNTLNSYRNFTYDAYYGVSYTTTSGYTYTTISVFGGQNEIYDPVFGGTLAYGIHNSRVYFGGIAGGYLQNNANLSAAGLNPVTLNNPSSAMGFSPIIGVELNFRFPLGDKVFFQLNNMITPGYLNSKAGLGFTL